MNTITCTCSAPIGIRHSVYCPVFPHEIARDEELGLLPKSPPVERDADGKLPRRFMVIDEAYTPSVGFSTMVRRMTGRERAPLRDVYPVWETDEHGEDREVWYGHMRIVRNRKRMRKLKRRGVLFMDLRAKTGRKHPDGYEGPRAWAWFTPRADVPAGTMGDVCR